MSFLAVVGASGGVGASTLATAVAVRARRADVGAVLVDGCVAGGGLDVMLGAEHEEGVRWPELARLAGSADGSALIARLPGETAGVPVLSFDRRRVDPPDEVVRAVLTGLAAASLLVVVDAPPVGPFTEVLLQLRPTVVLVAGESVRQLSALAVVVDLLAESSADLVVCMRGPSGPRGRPMRRLVETEIGHPVVATLDDDNRLAGDLVRGVAPGTRDSGGVARAADQVLAWALLGVEDVA